jgi:hypothetical protein
VDNGGSWTVETAGDSTPSRCGRWCDPWLEGSTRRREFITFVGGAATAWPFAARTQPAAIPRVGYVWVGARDGTDVSNAGLRQGLADRGYEIGRNLMLEERYADGRTERIAALIDELIALKVDVLVTVGTAISRVAQRTTNDGSDRLHVRRNPSPSGIFSTTPVASRRIISSSLT